ncbi:hypothetical protein PR048_031593 [Dryococelus australis]|uniref:Uncharacterized protein n=1 Tax=Dryococelus australis TaxID=614101 RepID=A0ABQ9G5Q3_9NEOP|nr:hypothetical protein PR048_031593 [Dryococelus australis]
MFTLTFDSKFQNSGEVLRDEVGKARRVWSSTEINCGGKRDITEVTRRPSASSGTVPFAKIRGSIPGRPSGRRVIIPLPLHPRGNGPLSPSTEKLDSTVTCILERQMFVHWLLAQRVVSVTSHLAVWHSLRVSLKVCYGLRVIQGVANKLRSNCEVKFSIHTLDVYLRRTAYRCVALCRDAWWLYRREGVGGNNAAATFPRAGQKQLGGARRWGGGWVSHSPGSAEGTVADGEVEPGRVEPKAKSGGRTVGPRDVTAPAPCRKPSPGGGNSLQYSLLQAVHESHLIASNERTVKRSLEDNDSDLPFNTESNSFWMPSKHFKLRVHFRIVDNPGNGGTTFFRRYKYAFLEIERRATAAAMQVPIPLLGRASYGATSPLAPLRSTGLDACDTPPSPGTRAPDVGGASLLQRQLSLSGSVDPGAWPLLPRLGPPTGRNVAQERANAKGDTGAHIKCRIVTMPVTISKCCTLYETCPYISLEAKHGITTEYLGMQSNKSKLRCANQHLVTYLPTDDAAEREPLTPHSSQSDSSPVSRPSRSQSDKANTEQRRNANARGTGDPRENPPTSGIARYDSHMRKSGRDRAETRTWFALAGAFCNPESKVCFAKGQSLNVAERDLRKDYCYVTSCRAKLIIIAPEGIITDVLCKEAFWDSRGRSWDHLQDEGPDGTNTPLRFTIADRRKLVGNKKGDYLASNGARGCSSRVTRLQRRGWSWLLRPRRLSAQGTDDTRALLEFDCPPPPFSGPNNLKAFVGVVTTDECCFVYNNALCVRGRGGGECFWLSDIPRNFSPCTLERTGPRKLLTRMPCMLKLNLKEGRSADAIVSVCNGNKRRSGLPFLAPPRTSRCAWPTIKRSLSPARRSSKSVWPTLTPPPQCCPSTHNESTPSSHAETGGGAGGQITLLAVGSSVPGHQTYQRPAGAAAAILNHSPWRTDLISASVLCSTDCRPLHPCCPAGKGLAGKERRTAAQFSLLAPVTPYLPGFVSSRGETIGGRGLDNAQQPKDLITSYKAQRLCVKCLLCNELSCSGQQKSRTQVEELPEGRGSVAIILLAMLSTVVEGMAAKFLRSLRPFIIRLIACNSTSYTLPPSLCTPFEGNALLTLSKASVQRLFLETTSLSTTIPPCCTCPSSPPATHSNRPQSQCSSASGKESFNKSRKLPQKGQLTAFASESREFVVNVVVHLNPSCDWTQATKHRLLASSGIITAWRCGSPSRTPGRVGRPDLWAMCSLRSGGETSSARREIQLLQPYGWYKGPHKGPSTPPAPSFGNDESPSRNHSSKGCCYGTNRFVRECTSFFLLRHSSTVEKKWPILKKRVGVCREL